MQAVLSRHEGGATMAISMDLSQQSYTLTGGEQDKQRPNLLAEIFVQDTATLVALPRIVQAWGTA
jgi:hypothetical protein